MPDATTFVHTELAPRLVPGESIVAIGFLSDRSLGRLILGGALSMMGSGYHFAALTDRRLALIHTRMGLGTVKHVNEGVTEIPLASIVSVRVHGPDVTITVAGGPPRTYKQYAALSRLAGVGDGFLAALASLGQPQAPHAPPSPHAASTSQAPAPAGGQDIVQQFRELTALRDAGVLTADEFGAKKAELLDRM